MNFRTISPFSLMQPVVRRLCRLLLLLVVVAMGACDGSVPTASLAPLEPDPTKPIVLSASLTTEATVTRAATRTGEQGMVAYIYALPADVPQPDAFYITGWKQGAGEKVYPNARFTFPTEASSPVDIHWRERNEAEGIPGNRYWPRGNRPLKFFAFAASAGTDKYLEGDAANHCPKMDMEGKVRISDGGNAASIAPGYNNNPSNLWIAEGGWQTVASGKSPHFTFRPLMVELVFKVAQTQEDSTPWTFTLWDNDQKRAGLRQEAVYDVNTGITTWTGKITDRDIFDSRAETTQYAYLVPFDGRTLTHLYVNGDASGQRKQAQLTDKDGKAVTLNISQPGTSYTLTFTKLDKKLNIIVESLKVGWEDGGSGSLN